MPFVQKLEVVTDPGFPADGHRLGLGHCRIPHFPFSLTRAPHGGFSFYFETGLQTVLTCTQGLSSLPSAHAHTHFISVH